MKLHERTSEFVSQPKLRVVDVPAWRSLFQKLARKEYSIIGLQPGVAIDLPSHLHTRPVADKPSAALTGRDEQKTRNGIDAVSQTFPPLHNHVRRNRNAPWKVRLDPRMHVDEIDWSGSGIGQHSEIVAHREYRAEGAQRSATWIVSAGDIRLHTDPWLQRQREKTVARIGCNRPRAYAARTETAELPYGLVVEIPIGFFRRR